MEQSKLRSSKTRCKRMKPFLRVGILLMCVISLVGSFGLFAGAVSMGSSQSYKIEEMLRASIPYDYMMFETGEYIADNANATTTAKVFEFPTWLPDNPRTYPYYDSFANPDPTQPSRDGFLWNTVATVNGVSYYRTDIETLVNDKLKHYVVKTNDDGSEVIEKSLDITLKGNNCISWYDTFSFDNAPKIRFSAGTYSHYTVFTQMWITVADEYLSSDNEYVFDLNVIPIIWTADSNDYDNGRIPLVPTSLEQYDELTPYLNESKNKVMYDIETTIVLHDWQTANVYMRLQLPYTKNPDPLKFESWVTTVTSGNGIVSPPITSPSVEFDGGFLSWLAEAVSNFMGAQIFPGVSMANILWFIIGIAVFIIVLKVFAGG